LLLTTPIGLYAAAFAAAALLIYRYWGPIKAFVGGALTAIGDALAPIGVALRGALQPVGRALAAAKPLWNGLSGALSTVAGWLGKLFAPARASADGLSAAAAAGRGFGAVLGTVLRVALVPLTWLGRALGGLAGLFVEAMGDARAALNGGLAALGTLILNWSPLGMFYRALAGVLSLFGVELPAKFSEFGGHLIDGLVGGISSGLGKVKDAISNMANSTVGWFKEKLGIHSPSRVFAQLGGFVGEGAALGMQGEQQRIAKAALGLATVAVASFGTPALAKPMPPLVQATVPIDRRAPLAAPSAASSPAAPASPIVINIYPQAGQDPHAIARAVEAALDRRERAKQSRIGSRLSD
ncbi:bacteriophage tail protein, partial [Burkholderia pseudomallei 1026a]